MRPERSHSVSCRIACVRSVVSGLVHALVGQKASSVAGQMTGQADDWSLVGNPGADDWSTTQVGLSYFQAIWVGGEVRHHFWIQMGFLMCPWAARAA